MYIVQRCVIVYVLINSINTPSPGFKLGPNKVYFRASSARVTWQQAKENCIADGGRLAVLDSPELNRFVIQRWPKGELKSSRVWIGGFLSENRVWKWIDGSEFGYENWEEVGDHADGNNNNNNNNNGCLTLDLAKGVWTRRPCRGLPLPDGAATRKFPFLCEYAAVNACFIAKIRFDDFP